MQISSRFTIAVHIFACIDTFKEEFKLTSEFLAASINGELFHFHENPNQKCPVGRNIHNVLDGKLIQIQDALENELGKITLEDVMKDTQYYIAKERE